MENELKTTNEENNKLSNKIQEEAEVILQQMSGYSYELAEAILQTAINFLPSNTYINIVDQDKE